MTVRMPAQELKTTKMHKNAVKNVVKNAGYGNMGEIECDCDK